MDELVWSKLSYSLGVVHPVSGMLAPDDELVAQKAFFDCMWEIDLAELLKQVKEDELNELNDKNREKTRTFRQVYLDEFCGGLSLFMHIPRLWLQALYDASTDGESRLSDREKGEHEDELFGFFCTLISKHDNALMLPTLHMSSLCHAAVRWDRRRNLTGNDLYDFNHAAAALSYCDAFFTERPLKSMLEQGHLGITEDFRCRVISDIDEAVFWVRDKGMG